MTHNDVLRRLRYALNINNAGIIEVFKLSGVEMTYKELDSYLKREDEDGYIECRSKTLNSFLNGLITLKRGPQKDSANKPAYRLLTNNIILKKIRVALKLKDVDILGILDGEGMGITKNELSALFRNEDHRNYKECGDQILRKFLTGLSKRESSLGDISRL